MKNRNITMIIPTIPKDYSRVKKDYRLFFDYLPISRIVYIGPTELEELVSEDAGASGYGDRIGFLNENELISFKDLKVVMNERIRSEGYEIGDNSRLGWYYQQFLKMEYANICEDEYYLTWDSDTIPLRKIKLFNDKGKPYLDTKPEYNPGYFRTIKNLFGLDKSNDESFIAEHMLFNVELMKEMMKEIEICPCGGTNYYEKIFYSVDIDNMKLGFSEFETYGTWVVNRHPEFYALRRWSSMRRANIFVDSHDLTVEDIRWLAKDFDAASFEAYHPLFPDLAEMFHNKEYRKTIRAKEMYTTVVTSGLFGEYVNGMIKEGELYSPV